MPKLVDLTYDFRLESWTWREIAVVSLFQLFWLSRTDSSRIWKDVIEYFIPYYIGARSIYWRSDDNDGWRRSEAHWSLLVTPFWEEFWILRMKTPTILWDFQDDFGDFGFWSHFWRVDIQLRISGRVPGSEFPPKTVGGYWSDPDRVTLPTEFKIVLVDLSSVYQQKLRMKIWKEIACNM